MCRKDQLSTPNCSRGLFFLPRFGCFVARVVFPLNISICSFSECFFGRILIQTFHGKVTSHQTGFNNFAFPASWGFYSARFDRSVKISDLKYAEKKKKSNSLDAARSHQMEDLNSHHVPAPLPTSPPGPPPLSPYPHPSFWRRED